MGLFANPGARTLRGHPLGHLSTGKKNYVPNFSLSLGGLTAAREFVSQIRFEPKISALDSGALLVEPLLNEAIRSVTHLDLALAGR